MTSPLGAMHIEEKKGEEREGRGVRRGERGGGRGRERRGDRRGERG